MSLAPGMPTRNAKQRHHHGDGAELLPRPGCWRPSSSITSFRFRSSYHAVQNLVVMAFC